MGDGSSVNCSRDEAITDERYLVGMHGNDASGPASSPALPSAASAPLRWRS